LGAATWDCKGGSLNQRSTHCATTQRGGKHACKQPVVCSGRLQPQLAKITVTEKPEFTAGYPHTLMSEVEVVTTGGQRLVERTPYPKGHARNPIGDAGIDAKFRSLSRGHLGAAGAGRALAALRNLQLTDSVDSLLDLFVP
jgi:2-methylcitrate dehydratase PrpD